MQKSVFYINLEFITLIFVSGKMIFITADQRKFYYPIFRANKKDSDLPLVMIDDSENLYLLPAFSEVDIPGKLKQFVQDFHTGKLKGFPK